MHVIYLLVGLVLYSYSNCNTPKLILIQEINVISRKNIDPQYCNKSVIDK